MKLGPLLGKRTWGGVIGIWPRHTLVDGGVTTQPEFSFWFRDIGWKVENYGVDPDIEVEFRPQDYVAGGDPQLLRGVEELMKIVEVARREAGVRPEAEPGVSRGCQKVSCWIDERRLDHQFQSSPPLSSVLRFFFGMRLRVLVLRRMTRHRSRA